MRKKILLLGGGFEQLIAIEIARELGYATLVVDDNPQAPGFAEADEFCQSRIKNTDQLIQDIIPYKIDGVFTHATELSVEVSKIAKYFNLPGISVESAENATFKHKRIACFKEHNINIPKFVTVSDTADWQQWQAAARSLKYPIVAKPTNGKGAIGVLLISKENELKKYYENVRFGMNSEFYLFEEFLRGVQYSTESVLFDGKIIRNSIADRHYDGMEGYYPYLIEDGHSMPVDISKYELNNIEDAILASCNALKISNGVVKGDILVDDSGKVYVIEMASRTSGGRFADFVTVRQCGVQILYPLIQMAMGDQPDRRYLDEKWKYGVSQRFIYLEPGTKIGKIDFIDIMRSRPGVEDISFSKEFLTTREQKNICSHRDRIGYVICRDSTREKADQMAIALCAEIINNMEKD